MSRLLGALAELYDDERRRWQASADYREGHGINGRAVAGFCGLVSAVNIVILPHGRFDLAGPADHTVIDGVAVEAFAEDGETLLDIVAWPIDDPANVRSLLGVVPILGIWHAHNSATYIFGRPLEIHRTALAWLQAGCAGVAITVPRLAGRLLMDLPGPFSGQDAAHVYALRKMVRAQAERVDFLIPERCAA